MKEPKTKAVGNGGLERIWKGNVEVHLKQNPSIFPSHLSYPCHLTILFRLTLWISPNASRQKV